MRRKSPSTIRPCDSLERGFSLVELVMVILLVGLMSVVVVSRSDQILFWRDEQSLRTFLNTWEFIFQEASGRHEAYRLVIDLDEQSYWVLREVRENRTVARQVDYLKNLRTERQRARREQQRQSDLQSVAEEIEQDTDRQAQSLEVLFFESVYPDPLGNIRLARPLEFPSLADPTKLSGGVRIIDVKLQSELRSSGQVQIRFHPQGAADFALVHFEKSDGSAVSAILNPSTGKLMIQPGYIDYEWTAPSGT